MLVITRLGKQKKYGHHSEYDKKMFTLSKVVLLTLQKKWCRVIFTGILSSRRSMTKGIPKAPSLKETVAMRSYEIMPFFTSVKH